MMPTPRKQQPQSDEATSGPVERRASLENWRLDELVRYGFTLDQACNLLDLPGLYVADIRESYLAKGCTPELAYRILCP